MKEIIGSKEEKREGKELWCRDYRKEGHTKNICPRKAFCDICQVMGDSIKDCPYNLKAHDAHVFYTHKLEEQLSNGRNHNTQRREVWSSDRCGS